MAGREVTFEDLGVENRSVISRTDLEGNITFANKAFTILSGFDKKELIGAPHSIVRHSDMPKVAFEEMWTDIKDNKKWHGFIKNLRKDGDYYWTESFIEPFYDDDGKKVGYMAARRPISSADRELHEERIKSLKEKE